MRVCGIELKKNEINLCLLEDKMGLFTIPSCRQKKIIADDLNKQGNVAYLQKSVAKLFEDYKVDHVVIKQRPLKGKFAGGGTGFKIESLIQLIDTVEVHLMSAQSVKALLKRNPPAIDFKQTELKQYQEEAFNVAYAFIMDQKYQRESEQD